MALGFAVLGHWLHQGCGRGGEALLQPGPAELGVRSWQTFRTEKQEGPGGGYAQLEVPACPYLRPGKTDSPPPSPNPTPPPPTSCCHQRLEQQQQHHHHLPGLSTTCETRALDASKCPLAPGGSRQWWNGSPCPQALGPGTALVTRPVATGGVVGCGGTGKAGATRQLCQRQAFSCTKLNCWAWLFSESHLVQTGGGRGSE